MTQTNKILDLPGSDNKDIPRRRYIVTQNAVVDGIALLANDIVMATDADYADLSARYPGTLVALTIERDPNREVDAKLQRALHPGQTIEWKPASFNQSEEYWEVLPLDNAWPYVDDHPCFRKATAIDEIFWDVVPFYSTDLADVWGAEGALPEAFRSDYLVALGDIVVAKFDPHASNKWPVYWAIHRATPAQRVEAMLIALGAPVGK